MDLKQMGWIDLAEVRDKWWGCCAHSNEALGSREHREFIDKLRSYGFSRKTVLHVVS
jgi:hypothetical protein